ncbi:MAG TPA: TerC family protein, partial [Polyangiaceae bacterium LLY-WYZ-15_(1-7)]|nr:TerC family protein [Polyangiaceae bacterium LLY-WYZ-15_(1-7)]
GLGSAGARPKRRAAGSASHGTLGFMSELFTPENFFNLAVLLFLQAVLGFDNLLYVSIESKRAPAEHQARVRRVGILMAIALRIGLLFAVLGLLDAFTDPFFEIHAQGVLEGEFNFATLVFLLGGVFIIYTAVKEIRHMISLDDLEAGADASPKSVAQVVGMIVVMNLVFSFDSILSAVAITRVVWVLGAAIVLSGLGMLLLADRVSEFLQKNRKYEVLGLFILLIVGVVLLGEGGHEAHLKIAGFAVEPMSKMTFYFSLGVLVAVDVLQSGYQKKLAKKRALELQRSAASAADPDA